MNLPKLKYVLTDPDEYISNAQLKALALELLKLVPMEGIEGSGLDSEAIMEVVLRAAVGTTSINGVTENTEGTPDRKTVMDWLHTLEKGPMLDAVNDILALVAMTVLDRTGREPSALISWTTRFTDSPITKMNTAGCKPVTAQQNATATVRHSSLHKGNR